jgi:hypothetical protein
MDALKVYEIAELAGIQPFHGSNKPHLKHVMQVRNINC